MAWHTFCKTHQKWVVDHPNEERERTCYFIMKQRPGGRK